MDLSQRDGTGYDFHSRVPLYSASYWELLDVTMYPLTSDDVLKRSKLEQLSDIVRTCRPKFAAHIASE